VLLALSALLAEPNPKDPLVPEIAHQLETNRRAYDAKAREFTLRYATPQAAAANAAAATAAAAASESGGGGGGSGSSSSSAKPPPAAAAASAPASRR